MPKPYTKKQLKQLEDARQRINKVVPVVGMEKSEADAWMARKIANHDGIVVILFSNGTSMEEVHVKMGTYKEHWAGIKKAWENLWKLEGQTVGMDDESRRLLAKILPKK